LEYYNSKLFALPGGFVGLDENLNDAVQRGLNERTGLKDIFLEQFYTFGDAHRNKTEEMKTIIKNNITPVQENNWILERMISVAYYALINYEKVIPKPDELSDSCEW
jgi:8-oxo-dGTP diphosphatase